MAKCFNRNTEAYKNLENKYGSPILVDSIIEDWQNQNNVEIYPSIDQVEEYLEEKRILFSIRKQKYIDALYSNLRRQKLIRRIGGTNNFTVNNTDKSMRLRYLGNQKYEFKGSAKVADNHRIRILKQLQLWGVNTNAAIFMKNGKTFIFKLDPSQIRNKDVISTEPSKDKTYIKSVLNFLQKKFPLTDTEFVTEEQAKKYYNKLDAKQRPDAPYEYTAQGTVKKKKKIDWRRVNSFYDPKANKIMLIGNKITDSSAVEEVLHPFVDALAKDNPKLYDNLLEEAKLSFPILHQQIKDTYNEDKGFRVEDQNRELVTQALSVNFLKDYKEIEDSDKPRKKWDQLGFKFMKWFANLIKEWFKYLTGTDLKIKVSDINYNTTLSDIAKVLNTTNIGFTFEKQEATIPAEERIKFSLEPKLAAALKKYKERATPEQKRTLDVISQMSEAHQEMIENYNVSGEKGEGGIITLDEETHTYNNLLDPKQKFKSVTTIIKGTIKVKHNVKPGETFKSILKKYKIKEDRINEIKALNDSLADIENLKNSTGSRLKDLYLPDERFTINRDIGNEFDTLMGQISLYRSFNDIEKDMNDGKLDFKYLSEKGTLYAAYQSMSQLVANLRGMSEKNNRSIVVPQVILGDTRAGIAGASDIFIIKPDGSVSIKDLKVSKHDVVGNKKRKKIYETEGFAVGPESKFWKTGNYRERTKKEKAQGVKYDPKIHQFELTPKQQHSMQLFMYGRLAANLGLKVNFDEMETIHIHADVFNIDKETQEFSGKFGLPLQRLHRDSENRDLLDKILILNPNAKLVQQAEEFAKQDKTDNTIMSEDFVDGIETPLDDADSSIIYDAIYNVLMVHQGTLIKKRDVLQKERDKVKLLEGDQEIVHDIQTSVNLINHIVNEQEEYMEEGYQEILNKTSATIERFYEYVENPDNWNKEEYIRKVLNYPSIIESYAGLSKIADGISDKESIYSKLAPKTKDAIFRLINNINKLNGTRRIVDGVEQVSTGAISEAIDNYVSEKIVEWSIKPELAPLRKEKQKDFAPLWEEYKTLLPGEKQEFVDGLNESQKEWLDSRIEMDNIMKYGTDIGAISASVRSLAVTDDTLVQIMEKMQKAKKQELLDRINTDSQDIGGAAGNLLRVRKRLGLSTDPKSMFEYMLRFDKDGKFKNQYVQKIGEEYEELQESLRQKMFDAEGNLMEYKLYEDGRELTDEEAEYNIKLKQIKKEFGAFFSAEEITDEGVAEQGEYHHYTQEFIDARNQVQEIIVTGKYKRWEKKDGVTEDDYRSFRNKYMNKKTIYRMIPDQFGNPSGTVVKDTDWFVKNDYREANDFVKSTGESLLSKRYQDIINPEMGNELKQAELTFYLTYVQYYEKYLEMLPADVRSQMTGRLPLILDTLTRQLSQSDTGAKAKLFAKLNPKKAWDQFYNTTSSSKHVYTNENGDFIDSLPIYYTGSPRQEKYLEGLNKRLKELEQQWNSGNLKGKDGRTLNTKEQKAEYNKERKRIKEQIVKLQMSPSRDEISLDLADSLLKFGTMAQNYDTMYEIEHTMKAFIDTISRREYREPDGNIYTRIGGKVVDAFRKQGTAREPRMIARVKKWMHMVYYDNDQQTRGYMDKLVGELISKSSLVYVGWNTWGNINNYMVGRLNNFVETFGRGQGHYFRRESYYKAEKLFNERLLPDLLHRLGGRTAFNDLTGAGRLTRYDKHQPISKYEALVDLFRMMDKKSDLREQGPDSANKKSWLRRASEWGFAVQDGMEYNVQTKVGMAILDSWMVKDKETGETMSMLDAFNWNTKDGKASLDGNKFLVIDYRTGEEREWNDQTRYEIRNYIRETNKQIHGNYAHEDRMVIQSHWLGQLAAQFHKWVVPAYDARFRKSYFDENLGWMEGRYISLWNYMKYMYQIKNHIEKNSLKKDYFNGPEGQVRMKNMWKIAGEAAVISLSLLTRDILSKVWEDDDDKSRTRKRIENLILYQLHRQQREFVQFVPVFGWKEAWNLVKSPFASSRWVAEITEAAMSTVMTPAAYTIAWVKGDTVKFNTNSTYVYQRGARKGEWKVKKNWYDALPILYTIERFKSYDTVRNFWVK
jgi:hypothetical protein